ncbi:P-loop containing nucleoside triphosphate hydrolase protein [Globomyces pollinis-pini]|nr:P-loop containing nucleoside triphosphate hydrolase protein [Globomyces pollinis-pini]KAJ2995475.1 translational elongation factor EF-1 alpha [Globomyces sp. JEL0801]
MTAQIKELLAKVVANTPSEERAVAAADLATAIKAHGISAGLVDLGVLDALKKAGLNKKQDYAREGAMFAYKELADKLGHPAEPYLIPELSAILAGYGDKQVTVRAAADLAGEALFALPSRFSVKILVPALLENLTNEKKWQTKIAALKFLANLTKTSASQVQMCLPLIIPAVSDTMWDTKNEVKSAATDCMIQVCGTLDNIDVIPFIPALVSCISKPEEVPECVYKLAATTFVQQVEAPTLAIMVPLLVRALTERKPAVLRQNCVIIDNMCKLVENPADAHQFLPKLMPGLDRIIEMGSDPELRNVASNARATMIRVGGGDSHDVEDPKEVAARLEKEHNDAVKLIVDNIAKVSKVKVDAPTVNYCASLITVMYDSHVLSHADWATCLNPYLVPLVGADNTKKVLKPVLEVYSEMDKLRQKENDVYDEDEGEELCNCEFSLAYGGMILLNNTKLRLTRGQRYGLCGPNGVGKSTLMRAIANGQLEGFPPADELKTVFVEHTLQAEEADFSVTDFCMIDKEYTREFVTETLTEFGFDDFRRNQPVGSLSGGWKMKLELARAMMENADILLLDEPTNHLDVGNVSWLCDYLTSLTQVTSMIVSHDSGFLDRVCTNIIHYENRKLKCYKGNLSKFVEQKPEAKSYYELSAAAFSFKFPEPGFLDGVKSKDKAILKMTNINFTYPGASRQALFNISLQCSLNSRIAVVGPNGAGKSTAIKVLTGEVIPDSGEVVKHPNLRVAYVAQHAFHHVEQHLDKTPNEYIRWRFQFGEDRELAAKASRQMTDEDKAQMLKVITIEDTKYQIETLMGRRKAKRSFEYELKFVGKSHDDNQWVSREKLENWGFEKIIQAFDDKCAALEGAYQRPLTAANVEKHLADVGLSAEFASHSRIRGLSGGQKVKVVLGACMWNQPHMLVLDEPTNYLDRDSLGALAGAITDFGGGVIIISHNAEFTDALCPEKWLVDNGVLTITGAKREMLVEKIELKEAETVTDAFGNVTKVKSTRKLSRKELKLKEKRRALKIKNGEPLSSDEEDL